MKHYLPITASLIFSFLIINATAQVTKLATNNNILSGFPLGSIAVMFTEDGTLWKTDGTSGGTSNYTTKATLDVNGGFAILNNKLYFTGVSATNGSELWVTDGTDAGTSLVKDIEAGAGSSSPRNIILFNNTLYFFASTTASGPELWKSDGTDAGTMMVKDINPGSNGSYNNSTFFIANNILFFTATDGTSGKELWKTDGSDAGTVIVKDINPGAASSNPSDFAVMENIVYFSANNGVNGAELWRSDGTGTGTTLVKDVISGNKGSSPSQFFLFKGELVFLATISGFPLSTYQIWSTDGTDAGTTLVYDYNTGFSIPTIVLSVIIGDKFYYTVTQATTASSEMWSSDGTTAGTALFKDFNAGGSEMVFIWPDVYGAGYSGSDFHSRLFNGKIFLSADNGTNGTELWICNGTPEGTTLVKDINPGAPDGIELASFGFYTQSTMYFPANDGTTGSELWKSDGTGGGTVLVQDINPGAGSSFSNFVMFFNGHVYFAADENSDGNNELFIVNQSDVLPLSLLDFTAALNGKAAQLKWTTDDEVNTKDFIVQRSYNAINFENIGTVKASGNTTQQTDYQFNDAGALKPGVAKVYYRLQMNDNDGKYTYSKTVSVNIIPQNRMVVAYPNPVRDQLSLTFNIAASAITVKIIDQNGKVVSQQQLNNIQAGNVQKINTGALKSGVYYVQWNSGNDVQSIKIVKY